MIDTTTRIVAALASVLALGAGGCSGAREVAGGGRPADTRPADTGSADPHAAPALARGPSCHGAALLAVPDDRGARGPWAVGARTIAGADTTIEVWYPAPPGADRGVAPARYDLRTAMPPAEAAKIPDADNAWLPCACARDLPVDTAHGPYPVVVFLHGAASFRAQSAFLAAHWASRGFVVVAPDLPGVGLAAALTGDLGFPLTTPNAVLDLVEHAPADGAADPLAFVRSQLGTEVALAGHSLGSMLERTVSGRSSLRVRIAMAGAPSGDGDASLLVLGGDRDHVTGNPGPAREVVAELAKPARVAVLHRAGHLAFSDLCPLGADRGGSLAIARAHGVAIPPMLASLATDGCGKDDASYAETAPVIQALTAGVLEETLRCDRSATAALAAFARDPRVDYAEQR